ncbi:hypothetical protein DFH28DRAFT_930786 [Melampsora americana]|nr:hypothetical protein DFH28DRAFT_930786 [Melampsora americana]
MSLPNQLPNWSPLTGLHTGNVLPSHRPVSNGPTWDHEANPLPQGGNVPAGADAVGATVTFGSIEVARDVITPTGQLTREIYNINLTWNHNQRFGGEMLPNPNTPTPHSSALRRTPAHVHPLSPQSMSPYGITVNEIRRPGTPRGRQSISSPRREPLRMMMSNNAMAPGVTGHRSFQSGRHAGITSSGPVWVPHERAPLSCEGPASAYPQEFRHLDDFRGVHRDTSSGEEDCLRHLLTDSGNKSFGHGPSEQLPLDRGHHGNSTSITATVNPLIRKSPPVPVNITGPDVSVTRPRLDLSPKGYLDCEGEQDDLTEEEARISGGLKNRRKTKTPKRRMDLLPKQMGTPHRERPIGDSNQPIDLTQTAASVIASSPKSPADQSSGLALSGPKRWSWPPPGELDVVWLSHLKEFEPFADPKLVVEQFYKCRLHIKAKWLKQVEGVTKRASGTQESDGELRDLIQAFVNQEEEMKALVREAKEGKQAAAINVARANELRDGFAACRRSAPARVVQDVKEDGEVSSDGGEVTHRPATTFRALRDGLNKKLQGDNKIGLFIDVTMKSSEAAQRANELTLVALDKYEKQAETARETLNLRREELLAASSRQDGKTEQINELKSSVAAVQGTLADMGSLLKLLAERIPPNNAPA